MRQCIVIKLVIIDLDNTLYNWVDFYVPSFNAMVKELSRLTGIDEKVLRESFKRVHKKHKTTEYAFSIQELDVLSEINAGLSVREILQKYDSAIKAFRVMRKKTLHLYDGVVETLKNLRSVGRKVVGHTDAMMVPVMLRVRQLGVENLIDGIVAQRDHGIPNGTHPQDVRYFDDPKLYETVIPFKKELEPDFVKPAPEGLKEILLYFDAKPTESVYVGDSLYKDIYMAQSCGVYDVYAKYGRQFNPDNYRQLVEITHWTEEDVKRLLKLKEQDMSPSFSISRFEELIDVIERIESKKYQAKVTRRSEEEL